MFEIIKEVTDWGNHGSEVMNHTYLHNKKNGRIYAYRTHSGEVRKFAKHRPFYKTHRKFKVVKDIELQNIMENWYE